tara:strand:+ start:381 stop:617 length:237 start_codon:yes stop_codon:yes gene_type:complete
MWPPNIKEFQNIALDALHQFKGKDISVLVYWNNPLIMRLMCEENIYTYSPTQYISQEMKFFDNGIIRNIKVIIGKKKN